MVSNGDFVNCHFKSKTLCMMNSFRSILLLVIVAFLAACNPELEIKTNNHTPEFSYDSIKAMEYGADEYGMKKYVLAFLKRGANQSLSKDSSSVLQRAHMSNINSMAEQGKLVLAGPFFGDQDLRGIYIFNVETVQEAEELTNTDPAIIAGVLEMELIEWYGSAALVEVNNLHHSLSKQKIIED